MRQKGCVYILKSGPYYKIGRTSYLKRRLKQICLWGSVIMPADLPEPPVLFHTLESENCWWSEDALHMFLAKNRIEGEWFRLEEWQVKFLLDMPDVDAFSKFFYRMRATRPSEITDELYQEATRFGLRIC
jgi:hypothetical protein